MHRIAPIPYDGYLPPSFNQERALAIDEWQRRQAGGSIPFHIVEGIAISGPLQPEVLEQCLNRILARHAGLRAAFVPAPGMTEDDRRARLEQGNSTGVPPAGLHRQIVLPEVRLPLNVVDLTSMETASRAKELQKQVQREALRPFEFDQAPLIRATLFRVEDGEHLLLMILHHLISDMISQRIIRRELRALYDGLMARLEPDLPRLTIHYPDFAAWQQRTFSSSSSLACWAERWLSAERGQLSLGDLPFCLPQTGGRPPIPAYEQVALDAGLTAEIRSDARRVRATLPVLFLTAFALILHRWTRRPVVSVWNNFANRVNPDTQDIVGWLVNSHLVPLDFSADPTAHDSLERVGQRLHAAVANQEAPSTSIWRSMSKPPQFSDLRVMFDFVEEDRIDQTPGPVSMTRLPLGYLRRFRFPMGLETLVIDRGADISLVAGYFQDRLPALGVHRMLEGMGRAASYLLHSDRQARVSAFPVTR